jgi:thioredoxin 1
MAICCFGICIPYTSLLPLLLVIFKPIMTFLGLWPFIESLLEKKKQQRSCSSEDNKSSCSASPNMLPYSGEYLTTAASWEAVVSSEEVTLVRFSAKWCKPCKSLEPLYYSLVGTDKTRSISVDIDEHDDICTAAKVMTLPTFQAYQHGECVQSITTSDAEALKLFISKYTRP